MKRKIKLLIRALFFPCALNFILLSDVVNQKMSASQIPFAVRIGVLSILCGYFLLIYLSLLVMPAFDRVKTGLRARMMLGGRNLVYGGLYSIAAQIAVFLIFYINKAGPYEFGIGVLTANAILASAGAFLLIFAGAVRIFFTSRRLSIARRIVILLTMWIPAVNLFVLIYACRLVYEE